jgi:hypothetical protein
MDASLITVGVDWLTLTTKDRARIVEWREVFDAISKKEQASGWKEQPMQQRGFQGKQIGHLFVGEWEGIGLTRISSSWAQEYGWWFSPDAVNCTRVDLQATWEMNIPVAGQMRKWYEAARISRPRNGRPGYYRWIENTEGGVTIEANKRVTARMGRIYDKGRQMDIAPAGRIIRWEMEIKEELANQAVYQYYASAHQDAMTLGTLKEFFESKGLPFPNYYAHSSIKLEAPKEQPDVEQTLKWLQGPVAKAVARSVGWVGMSRTLSAVLSETLQESSDCDNIMDMLSSVVGD